jgi:serine/threonine protein kinase, bacterial
MGTIRRMPLASGQIFAGYTIVRLLGSGGMGEVYLAVPDGHWDGLRDN